jgi:hypothetical protein
MLEQDSFRSSSKRRKRVERTSFLGVVSAGSTRHSTLLLKDFEPLELDRALMVVHELEILARRGIFVEQKPKKKERPTHWRFQREKSRVQRLRSSFIMHRVQVRINFYLRYSTVLVPVLRRFSLLVHRSSL